MGQSVRDWELIWNCQLFLMRDTFPYGFIFLSFGKRAIRILNIKYIPTCGSFGSEFHTFHSYCTPLAHAVFVTMMLWHKLEKHSKPLALLTHVILTEGIMSGYSMSFTTFCLTGCIDPCDDVHWYENIGCHQANFLYTCCPTDCKKILNYFSERGKSLGQEWIGYENGDLFGG